MENEIWKDISGFKGKYQVNNLGNIRSTNYRMKGIIKNLVIKNNDRYSKIDLYDNGVQVTRNVHRIVAETFLIKPSNKSEVNHKDLNRYNNSLDNLEWVTELENKIHYQLNKN